MSQCVWMLVQILGKEYQGEEQDEAILSLEDIQLFSLNLEAVYKMLCKWGILWTMYLLYR